jgi:hypothetical protein
MRREKMSTSSVKLAIRSRSSGELEQGPFSPRNHVAKLAPRAGPTQMDNDQITATPALMNHS